MLETRYGAHREGAEAYRDQEVSRLFVECKWTQVRIAERMGRQQNWVSRRLLFGRFLRFITTCDNLEFRGKPLTEGRFREAWRVAGKKPKETEAERFARCGGCTLPRSYSDW